MATRTSTTAAPAAAGGPTREQTLLEIAFLTPGVEGAHAARQRRRLADRGRVEGWTARAVPGRLPATRGVRPVTPTAREGRIRAARFPARKSLEEFDFDHQRSLKRETIAHLGTLDFITSKDNAIFLGPPGTGKTMLAIGLGIRACQAGAPPGRVRHHRPSTRVARLATAHHAGRLQAEITKLGRTPLLIIDEVGYLPFRARSGEPVLSARLRPLRTGQPHRHQQQALRPLGRGLRRRCGRRRHDRPARPSRRGHLAERRSYRLRNRDLGRVPTAATDNDT